MKKHALSLGIITAAFLCANVSIAFASKLPPQSTPFVPQVAFTAEYVIPTWPQPSTADINGKSIANLPSSATANNGYIAQALTLTYGTSGSSLGTVDFWTTGDTSPTGDGPLQILQTGTPTLSGAISGNTQTIALAISYAPCGTTTATTLTSGTPLSIPSANSVGTACTTQHAAINYAFTPPSNAPIKADTYSLPNNFSLTVQQGL